MPSKNHHCTPFIATSTTASGPSSGAMRAATPGNPGPFTATTTRSCRSERRRIVGRCDRRLNFAIRHAQAHAMRLERGQVAPRATAQSA